MNGNRWTAQAVSWEDRKRLDKVRKIYIYLIFSYLGARWETRESTSGHHARKPAAVWEEKKSDLLLLFPGWLLSVTVSVKREGELGLTHLWCAEGGRGGRSYAPSLSVLKTDPPGQASRETRWCVSMVNLNRITTTALLICLIYGRYDM